jgi:hypothetical protein
MALPWVSAAGLAKLAGLSTQVVRVLVPRAMPSRGRHANPGAIFDAPVRRDELDLDDQRLSRRHHPGFQSFQPLRKSSVGHPLSSPIPRVAIWFRRSVGHAHFAGLRPRLVVYRSRRAWDPVAAVPCTPTPVAAVGVRGERQPSSVRQFHAWKP